MSNIFARQALKKICSKIGSGSTPRGGKEAYKDEGISIIRSQNILDFSFSTNGLAYIDEDQAKKLSNVILEQEDVLLNITGDSVARVCMVPNTILPARVNQHVAIVRANQEILHPGFLKYSLLSPRIKKELLNLSSSGATRNALTKSMIEEFEISLPPLPEQKAIAKILGDLDDKIELNRKMNQTLEEMAQALFKSWFVDFDPVLDNAIAAGNTIPEALQVKAEKRKLVREKANSPSLPKEIQELFPKSFVFNEELEKWIPEGWEVKSLDSNVKLDTASVKPFDFPNTIFDHYSIPAFDKGMKISKDLGNEIKSNKYQVKRGAILVSKLNPSTKRIWYVGNNLLEDSICSTEFMQMIPADLGLSSYYYCLFNSDFFLNEINSTVTGSTGSRQRAQPKMVAKINIIEPSKRLLMCFSEEANFILNKKLNHLEQIESLTRLRDTLLPQLISGKLRVPEAMINLLKDS